MWLRPSSLLMRSSKDRHGYMKGPEQARAHIPIQTPIQSSGSNPQIPFQTPPFQTNVCNVSKLTLRWVSVPCLFHIRFRPSIWRILTTYQLWKQQESVTLRIKCAFQTLRIRQHKNVHSGHMVLTKSHVSQKSAVLVLVVLSTMVFCISLVRRKKPAQIQMPCQLFSVERKAHRQMLVPWLYLRKLN